MSSSAIRRSAPANPATAAVATSQIFALASNPALAATVSAPGASALDGRRFTVRAEGAAFVNVAAYTIKPTLFGALAPPAAPLVPANWTLLGTGTARAVAAQGWAPWWIEAHLIFDSRSGALQGIFNQMANNLYDIFAAIPNQVTGINGTNSPISQAGTVVQPANPAVYFAVGLTFGTADGANIGSLTNFEVGF